MIVDLHMHLPWEMDELVRKIEFVELAASADFQDHFIDELGFETGE